MRDGNIHPLQGFRWPICTNNHNAGFIRWHDGMSGAEERVVYQQLSFRLQELSPRGREWDLEMPEQRSPLCGNSIHQDRRFLICYMPKIESYAHYRNIDVSTIKELANHRYPELPKQGGHLALADIHESIRELKYYRQKPFLPTDSV